MIHAVVIGHLGADAELRYTDSGMAVLRIRVAASSRLKVDGEYKDVPTWVSVDVVGKRAEALAKVNLAKGSRIATRGMMHQREYDKRDGGKGYSLELRADDVELLGDKRADGQAPRAQAPQQQARPVQQAAPARRPDPVQQNLGDVGDDYTGGYGGDDEIPF